jgi:hypothetical protein
MITTARPRRRAGESVPANPTPGELIISFPRYPAYQPSGLAWLGDLFY